MAFLMNGCASVGDAKEQGQEEAVSTQTEETGAEAQQANESKTEVSQQPKAKSVVDGGSRSVPEAGPKTETGGFQQYAASVKEALSRFLPKKLSELNWYRIATIVVGIVMMGLIYGLAFALARLPQRKRTGSLRGVGPQVSKQAAETVSE
jgi:hypothetical protein